MINVNKVMQGVHLNCACDRVNGHPLSLYGHQHLYLSLCINKSQIRDRSVLRRFVYNNVYEQMTFWASWTEEFSFYSLVFSLGNILVCCDS